MHLEMRMKPSPKPFGCTKGPAVLGEIAELRSKQDWNGDQRQPYARGLRGAQIKHCNCAEAIVPGRATFGRASE